MKQGGVWLLEEATGLLRELPARSWVVWLAGTLPFTWLWIVFLLEMARSAFSGEQIVGKSLLLAVLYVGKHAAQAVFSRDCLQVLRGDRVSAPGAKALARLLLAQAAVQPFRMPVLSLTSLAVMPYPRVAAFLRNVGPCAIDRERGFVREAWQLGRTDTRAHSVALLILSLCWLLLYINLFALWFVLPMLLKAFFGVQTEMTRLAGRMVNPATFFVTAVLTQLAVEPVLGALAGVRAFYAQARHGGEDLRGILRRMTAAVALLAVLAGAPSLPVRAQERPLDAAVLDREIDDVLRDAEFAWKMPKAVQQEESSTWMRGLFDAIGRWLAWLVEIYRKLFPKELPPLDSPPPRWNVDANLLRWAMIGTALLAAGCVVLIVLSRKKEKKIPVPDQAVSVAPVDVRDENVSASQLPEEEWLQMADQFAAQHEFRLAMRALHLAGLRYLGEKGWVTLQPAKTGSEYGRELARRLRDVPAAIEGFGRGLREYEGVWYGFGAAEAASYHSLRMTWEEMRRHA